MLRTFSFAVAILSLSFHAQAADHPLSAAGVADQPTLASWTPQSAPNSIFVFGGQLSASDIYSTALFNFPRRGEGKNYDNFIVGGGYARDIWSLGYGIRVGGEFGFADRFGHYPSCCDATVVSSGFVHSLEFWFGPRIRHEGFVLFNSLRISSGVTFGFSVTNNSIGREREREASAHGNARLLLYLGPEFALSMVTLPNWELVWRLHHRSGAGGVFGHIMEGYNAIVFGVRYLF